MIGACVGESVGISVGSSVGGHGDGEQRGGVAAVELVAVVSATSVCRIAGHVVGAGEPGVQ